MDEFKTNQRSKDPMKSNKKKSVIGFVIISVMIMIFVVGCSNKTPYQKYVASFTPITIEEVNNNIENGTPFVLYFSRESCSFCSEVIKNVRSAAKEMGVEIFYIDTDTPDIEKDESYVEFRKEYDIEFDPAMLLFTKDDYYKGRLITDTDEIALTFKKYLAKIAE